jgi:hypothetical protein
LPGPGGAIIAALLQDLVDWPAELVTTIPSLLQDLQALSAGLVRALASIEAAIVPRLEAASLPLALLLQPLAPIDFSIGSAIVGAIGAFWDQVAPLFTGFMNLFSQLFGAVLGVIFAPVVAVYFAFFIALLLYSIYTGTPIFF